MSYIHSRKFLLIFSLFGAFFLFFHLIFVYLYEGGKHVGETGGSVKIGLIGKAPTIPNPLEYDLGSLYNDIVLRFLFRSIIRYNPATMQYEGDIANCDIRNLSDITCTLRDGNVWSDGTDIVVDDVLTTYNGYKNRGSILPTYESTVTNPNIDQIEILLKNITVTATGKTIRFTSTEKSANMIDILTYPILRSDMFDRIKSGRLSEDNYITSGDYLYDGYDSDAEYNFDRITLKRNPLSKNTYIDTYQFRFYPDTTTLKKNEDTLNIILPNRLTDPAPTSPRFMRHTYHIFEYVSLFANTDRLNLEMRTNILSRLNESPLMGNGNSFYTPIDTIFFTGASMIPTKGSGTLDEALTKLGYYRTNALIAKIDARPLTVTGEVDYGKNQFFTSPSEAKYYFSSGMQSEIKLIGKVSSGVSAVRINGYTLQEYHPGDTEFVYTVSAENGTLMDGINVYTLTFIFPDGTMKDEETLTIYNFSDADALTKARTELDTSLLSEKNTPELQAERQAVLDAEKAKIRALDPQYFYTESGERYTLNVLFLEIPEIADIANTIRERLMNMGIHTVMIPTDSQSIATMMNDGKEQYDLIIVGFEAPNRISNIAPVFSSTTAKSGINFSNIESDTLDDLLQNLRVTVTEQEQIAVEQSIADFIKKDALMIPLYSINRSLYFDKNIINTKLPTIIPDLTVLPASLSGAFIKSDFILNLDGKSFGGFFTWIGEKITSVGK